MDMPPGHKVSKSSKTFCKLKKYLFGLKQSPRTLFHKFAKAMKKFGNTQYQAYHTLFLKESNEGKNPFLLFMLMRLSCQEITKKRSSN